MTTLKQEKEIGEIMYFIYNYYDLIINTIYSKIIIFMWNLYKNYS
jgi:hypothetical protein